MTFKPGQSGNPGGLRKYKEFTTALRLELAAAGDDQKALRRVARKLIAMAERGDMSAIREIADRLEGKVPQAQIIQGDEDGGRVRYYAEMPIKDKTTEEWLRGNPVKAEPTTH